MCFYGPFFTLLTIRTYNSRTTFTEAFAGGAMWRFCTAGDGGESGYQVCASNLYAVSKHGGLIVELLKDLVSDLDHQLLITSLLDSL